MFHAATNPLGFGLRSWHVTINVEAKPRRMVDVGEIKVKADGEWCYMWAAIDVDTHERTKDKVLDYVKMDWNKIEEAAKNWDAEPYFAYIRIVPENREITFFLLPVSKGGNMAKTSTLTGRNQIHQKIYSLK
ncbi:MAG: hypothetical protein QXU67_01910 [Candidatus Bathyarchaeia archaeon]